MGTLQAVDLSWLLERSRWLVSHLKVRRCSFSCLSLLQQFLDLAELLGHCVFGLGVFLFSFLKKFDLFLDLFSCRTMGDPCIRVRQKSLKFFHLLDAGVVCAESDIVGDTAADSAD